MNKNKETISEYCWAGRATGAVGYLLKKYAHVINQYDVDSLCEQWLYEPFKLTTQLALILREQIPQQDSRIVDCLLEKSKSIIEENPTQLKGKDQKEFEFGIKEVNYIINKGENLEVILQDRVFRKLYKKYYCSPTFVQVLFWLVIVYGVVCGGVYMYHFCPYFVEQRLYDRIVNPQKSMLYNIETIRISTLMRNCESYIEQFPEGENITKVKEIYNELRNLFEDKGCELIMAGGSCGSYIIEGESESGLNSRIEDYKSLYPNGKYLTKLYAYYDSLWTNEVNQFSAINTHGGDAKSHNFILSMLKYMKDSHIDVIVVNTNFDISEIKQVADSCYDAVVREDFKTTYPQGSLISMKDALSEYISGRNLMENKLDKLCEEFDLCMCKITNRPKSCRLYEMVSEYVIKRYYENVSIDSCPKFVVNVKITNKELIKNGKTYPQFFVIEGAYQRILYDVNYNISIILQLPNEESCCIYENTVSIADLEDKDEIKTSLDVLMRLEDICIREPFKKIGL